MANIEDMPGDRAMDILGRLRRVAAELQSISVALSGAYAWVPEQGRVSLDKAACDAGVDVAALYDIVRAFGAGGNDYHAARVLGKPHKGRYDAKALRLLEGDGQ